ncbi:hypothetical protein CMI37_15685 [Candidatus Pacearchaeota archaeon]|nr:hypothetical protein [Candidatus Pacearchaeota archaeon]
MIKLDRSGSYDGEDKETIATAVKWATRCYGPTDKQLRGMCSCLTCRDEQERRREWEVVFFEKVEELRGKMMKPGLLFND